MNPVAVFMGLLACCWALPILMLIEAIGDRVDDLELVGEFLAS